MPNSKRKIKFSLIKNSVNRNNTKCKRKTNLFKKSMQLSKLCNQDIILVIYDKELGKLYQYRSSEEFDIDRAKMLINEADLKCGIQNETNSDQPHLKVYNYFDQDIMSKAKVDQKYFKDSDDDCDDE